MNQRATNQFDNNTPTTFTPVSGILRRKCDCGNHTMGGGNCDECEKKASGSLRRAAAGSGAVSRVPPIVHEVLTSPGQALDGGTRAFMEPRFGHNLSHVRVHTDTKAAESARAVNALAYTVGRHVVFGGGQYAPGTGEGRALIAHELMHVSQLGSGRGSTGPLVIGSEEANEEKEARSAEAVVSEGGRLSGPASAAHTRVLRRQPAKPGGTASTKPAFSCLQDGTGKDIKLDPGTVTVIEYGFEGCDGCEKLQPVLDSICKNYKAYSKFSVNFYSVDALKPEAAKSKPTVPAGLSVYPTTLIFSGATKVDQFEGGAKPEKEIYAMINKAAASASPAKAPTTTTTPTTTQKTSPTPTTTPTTAPTATGQACAFSIVGIDGKDSFDDTRKFTDDEIAKDIAGIREKIKNPNATADQLRKQTANCQLQTFQLLTNEQNARILHVAWRKAPPAGTLSVQRAAIDNGGDQPPGKVASVSTLNPKSTPLPAGCAVPKLPDKPAWCVPFCSFGEFLMEVSVAYECDPPGSKQINTINFGPKKITLSEKKP